MSHPSKPFFNSAKTKFACRTAPEKSSCDSGVITPSEGGSLTSPDCSEAGPKPVSVGKEPPVSSPISSFPPRQVPAQAAVVTSELDEDRFESKFTFPTDLNEVKQLLT